MWCPVPELRRSEPLAATRQLVVLLRLTVGADGRVLYGEVVDPETGAARPFHGLDGVSGALRDWLGNPPSAEPERRSRDLP